MNNKTAESVTVYYPKSRGANLFFASVIFLLLLFRLITFLTSSEKIFPFDTIILIAILLFFVFTANQIRLVVSKGGIEYYQVGYKIKTGWQNIDRIGEIRTGRIISKGLILSQPALITNGLLGKLSYIQSRSTVIPLSFFVDKNNANSPLHTQLQHYAPHLFE